MKDALQILDRLGVSQDQFCLLTGICRDDLFATTEGAAVPLRRAEAILKLLRYCGKDKLKPILAIIDQGEDGREWRPVIGFPAYEVSDDGRVRRVGSSGRGSLRTLKPIMKNHGYYSVTLYRHGTPESQRVHRLVCEAFHGPAPVGKPFVCHKDGSRTNNVVANLYWGSAADNSADWQRERRERIRNAVHRAYTPEWRKQKRALKAIGYDR